MICVVGGSGFVGTRLCRRLSNGSRDFSIVDKAQSLAFSRFARVADVRDLESLRQAIADGTTNLVNLAAEHRDDVRPRSLYDDVNVGGARNLVRVAVEKNIPRILFTSSVACYGFAPPGTDESGVIAPFNDYGRTKVEAEQVLLDWWKEAPQERSLTIVRPTVIFGERNRGNVFNLLNQIASGRFLMIGEGKNVKSMAYVENVAAFLEFCLDRGPGLFIHNYIDTPDVSMEELVGLVRRSLGRADSGWLKIPFHIGLLGGHFADLVAQITKKSFPISAIRVRKFCATTQFRSNSLQTGFVPTCSLIEGLERTIRFEFVENHSDEQLFFSE